MITIRTPRRLAVAFVALLLPVAPTLLYGQDRVKTVSEGDGRVHGASVMPVSEADLHPGQVTTINLHPRYHAILEFPYPVAQIDAGDPDVFTATIVGNKVTLKATKLDRAETTMSIILGDANLTVVPFLIRADSTQPMAYVVRYTDPIAKHLNRAEADLAAAVQKNNDARVTTLSELRLQQRLLMAGDLVRINKTGSTGERGERVSVTIESAQQLPGDDGRPKLYMRYKVLNETVAPLTDLFFTAKQVTTSRHALLFSKSASHDVYDVQDVRSVSTIPPGAAAYGLLIFDDLQLKGADQALDIEATAFNNQRHLVISRVLVGHEPGQ
jgi:hypothetical protein